MKIRSLLLALIVLLCSQSEVSAQLEVLDFEVEEFVNDVSWTGFNSFKVANRADSMVQFDWLVQIPEDLDEYVSISVHDHYRGWLPTIHTTCGLNSPNNVLQFDTARFSLTMHVEQPLPADLVPKVDSIKFVLLSHPDCSTVLSMNLVFENAVSVEEEQAPKRTRIFPNPVGDLIRLEGQLPRDVSYRIRTSAGKLVQQGQVVSDEIPLGFQTAGNYILLLDRDGELESHTFVKL